MTDNRTPEQIRADIETQRTRLSDDVDAVAEKVTPSKAAGRQMDRARSAASDLRDRVMGTADDASHRLSEAQSSMQDSVREGADRVSHAAQEAPRQVRSRTQGSPLAAGAIAFGIGYLVASLLPSTEKERSSAATLEQKAQPLLEDVKQQGQDMAQQLKEPAQESLETLRESAQDSAQTVKGEGQTQASDVADSAKGSAQELREN